MERFARLKPVFLLVSLGVLLSGTPAAAQTAATGNIEGLVTDVSGGVLPGVTVQIRNSDTNVAREVVTGE